MTMKIRQLKTYGYSKSSSKREVYCIKKQEKHQIYNLILHLKQLDKEEKKKKSPN